MSVPSTARKRTDTERFRDFALIARYHGQGMTDAEIAQVLNSRPDVTYELSRRTITNDRNDIERAWLNKSQDRIDAYIQESIARLDAVENEAWQAWFRSMEPAESESMKEELLRDADGVPLAQHDELTLTERVMNRAGQVGDAKFLKIILDANQQRDKLRNLHKIQVQIEQRTMHVVKTYHNWSPQQWDDGPQKRITQDDIIDGHYLEAGDET